MVALAFDPCRRCFEYSRKPATKMCSSAPPFFACDAFWKSSFRSPPCQNASSKRSASRFACASWKSLRKICHQLHSDSSASSAMTACTTIDAFAIIATNDRSVCTFMA